jgi:cation diffusion facilitator CzcD-associated flavoprotein CzcO
MTEKTVDTVIVGAGPYGLALAAYATHLGIDHLVLGDAMGFWRENMPGGMYLRSASDWHLDPLNVHTIEAYAATLGKTALDIEPISRDFYLDYANWFQEQKGLVPLAETVVRLDRRADGGFSLAMANGDAIVAQRVVLALGFGTFSHVPGEIASLLPDDSYGHTRDEVDFSDVAGVRCLIVGGRQSAYEWAALMGEAGASEIHIVHRHPAPAFAVADWSWVGPMVDGMIDEPEWYRRLPQGERDEIGRRLYAEGRLKLEPWLQARIEREGIHVWANRQIAACMRTGAGDLRVTLSDGEVVDVDRIILATGYKVQIDRLPLLASGNVLPLLETRNGFPVLDEGFQTSVPGLYITSMPATQDFGPFFAFTIAARMSARVIGRNLVARERDMGYP